VAVSLLTPSAALKPAWLLQALSHPVEFRVVCNGCCRAGLQRWDCISAFDGLPALVGPSGEGPHVGAVAGVVMAEAELLVGVRSIPAAGARVRAAPQHKRCGKVKCELNVSWQLQ
jgi:hypothetical protein